MTEGRREGGREFSVGMRVKFIESAIQRAQNSGDPLDAALVQPGEYEVTGMAKEGSVFIKKAGTDAAPIRVNPDVLEIL